MDENQNKTEVDESTSDKQTIFGIVFSIVAFILRKVLNRK